MRHDILMKRFHLFTQHLCLAIRHFFGRGGTWYSFCNYDWGFCANHLDLSLSFSFYLCCFSRWFIKYLLIIKHSLIVCECVCLRAGVSPGNYLMLWSLMTTQTNICPEVIYKMRGWPSVVSACHMQRCMITWVSNTTYIAFNTRMHFTNIMMNMLNQQKQTNDYGTLSAYTTLQMCSHTPTQSSYRSALQHRRACFYTAVADFSSQASDPNTNK